MNYIAILVTAFVGMSIGFFWFGPLFGKMWVSLAGFTKEDMEKAQEKGMGKTYIYAFLAVLLMAYATALLVASYADSLGGALRIGLLVWLAGIVPFGANSVLWEGKNKKLFYLNIAERLVTLLVMSAILFSWQ